MVNISLMIGFWPSKGPGDIGGKNGKGKGKGKDTHRQIGNAFPTPLAEALGREIRKAIENNIW